MDKQQLSHNIDQLVARVRCSAKKSQFSNSDILVVAVSKTRPASHIQWAYENGLRHFGENYLQEALSKMDDLRELPLSWHFIGPIQSNKAASIAERFDWVHSIDRAKIARRLSDHRPPHMSPLQVCLQVNVSGEDSKSGVTLAALPDLAKTVLALPGLNLRGLMAIPAAGSDEKQQRQDFASMRAALSELQALAPGLDTLSMGMSADLEAAIAEGATMVRVGTALFGPRNR